MSSRENENIDVLPVKSARENEIVIHAELVQSFMEISLVNQTACSIDNDQSKDHPAGRK